jgi:hypothetical protein
MKTLIIHPHDESTHFLKPIYESIPNKTVITGGWGIVEVRTLISMHDRIIMMGNGSPKGLFGINFNRSYVIDEDTVDSLQYKKCIFIWCHADQFVKQNGLKGLYSGMFVSEVTEALIYKLKGDKQLINESNNTISFPLTSLPSVKANIAVNNLTTDEKNLLKVTLYAVKKPKCFSL